MMLLLKNQNLIRYSLLLFLVLFLNPAFSNQKIEDTIVERLLNQGEYRLMSGMVKGQLKKLDEGSGNDLRLYYFNKLSMASFRLNNFDSAMICARQALLLSSSSKDSTLISEAWKMMSYSFNRLGQLDSSIYFTNKLLNYSKRAGDDKQYRNALISMGTIMMQNQLPSDALKNFTEANRVNKKMSDTAYFSIDYFNIGLVHLRLKQYDSCLHYMRETLGILQKFKNPNLLFMTYGTTSDCYREMGKKKERKKYLLLAMDVAEQLESYQFKAMGYCDLVEGALDEEDYNGAVKYGFAADSLLEREPFPVQQMKLDSMMYVAFSKLSKPAEALARYESFVKLKSQVISEKQSEILNRMIVEYGVKEKNLKIEKQELEISSKKKQLLLLVILFVITILFTSRLIYQYIKLRNFRESLYRKEKYLDNQIAVQAKFKTGIDGGLDGFIEKSLVELPDTSHEELTNVDPGLFDALYIRILSVLETQKLYLDPEMSIKNLVSQLGTNKTYLYQAISRNGSENFRTLINRYRVNEAKRIIEECVVRSTSFDTTSIFIAAGFKSAVSFYRAFKHYTGLSPKEYAGEVRRDHKSGRKVSGSLQESDPV